MQWPTFSTDGLPLPIHFSPIRKLVFITKFGGANAQIGAIDELLNLSTWSLTETSDRDMFDLSLSIGGHYKLLENYSENLMDLPQVRSGLLDLSMGLELEFNNIDPSVFYFSIPSGLFKANRREGMSLVRLDT